MKYINKGKRDILIFPQFENINKLENIRKQYDELYGILPPHITLAFPFESHITNEDLEIQLKQILKQYKPFSIKMENISFHRDDRVDTNYIFLDFVDGQNIVYEIHNKIYEKILNTSLSFEFIPHITLGNTDELVDIELEDEFETIIDEVIVEEIGENEESNIVFRIKL